MTKKTFQILFLFFTSWIIQGETIAQSIQEHLQVSFENIEDLWGKRESPPSWMDGSLSEQDLY